MMTIEEEIEHIISFLSNPAGYTISMNGDLTLFPIYGAIEHWEVSWNDEEDNMACDCHKIFLTLKEAAQFFVEKRRYMCLGVDFIKMYNETDGDA